MGKRINTLNTASSPANDDYLPIDGATNGTRKISADFVNNLITDVEVDGTSVVTSGVAEIDLSGKQDTLTAGSNIQIAQDGTISATDTTYTAGTNVQIDNGVISATDTTYTAGTNVQINNNVISATDTTYTAGTNVQINNGVISATDTTYSAFGGATAGADGSSGLVPQPLIADKDKFLKGDGTWDTIQPGASALDDLTNVDITSPTNGQVLKYDSTNQEWVNANESGGGGSTVTVTQKTSTGTNIADITVDGVTTQLYAPNGGGGASAVSDLTDVDLTNLEDGQILKYDATNQKWINADEGGGSTEVRRYLGQLCPRVTGTDSHISQSSNGSYGQTEWYSWGAFSDNTITTWGVPDSGAAWVDNHDNSPWISYHFDEPRYFTELTIDCGSNYGGSFTGSIYIEASNDGTAWVDIGGGVKTINAPYQSIGTNTYALDDADTWEYIRIRGTQSFWILNTPSCFIQSINVYGGDIISKNKSDIVVVSRTDNTNGYAWLTPCDANGNTLKPSEVTLLSIFAESDMSGAPPYYNGLHVCVNTDNNRYYCKLYDTQTGEYAPDGTYSVDYTVAYIPNSGGSGGGGSSAEEMTLDEYNELTEQQKNDGTIRFIPYSTDTDTPFDMSSIANPGIQGSMSNTTTSTTTNIIWNGDSAIADTLYYTNQIDVTNADKIVFDLTIGSHYPDSRPSWRIQIGLMSTAPTNYLDVSITDSRWLVAKDYYLTNSSYTNQELDVSQLTGSYYLIINAHGWNATFENIALRQLTGNPSQIKYMSKTYADNQVSYSSTEHQVGTWIDGSDVYEKTISISNISLSSGSYETVDTITGLDTIISCNGYVVEGNLKYTLNDVTLRVIQDGTSVKLYSPSGTTWTISSGAIIIRYTKVTS